MKRALYRVTFGFKDGERYTENVLSETILAESGEDALAEAKKKLSPLDENFYLSSIECLARES